MHRSTKFLLTVVMLLLPALFLAAFGHIVLRYKMEKALSDDVFLKRVARRLIEEHTLEKLAQRVVEQKQAPAPQPQPVPQPVPERAETVIPQTPSFTEWTHRWEQGRGQ